MDGRDGQDLRKGRWLFGLYGDHKGRPYGGAPFVLRTFPPRAGETLPRGRPGHTPLASLRLLAPLSLCERGVGV